MSTERISMRHLGEVLRLAASRCMSQRQIAKALHLSQGVISKYLTQATAHKLSWPLDPSLDDAALSAQLFPASVTPGEAYRMGRPSTKS
ncbi:MAG: hypothetical protein ACYDEV_07245 [Acidiferrobacter sp.]